MEEEKKEGRKEARGRRTYKCIARYLFKDGVLGYRKGEGRGGGGITERQFESEMEKEEGEGRESVQLYRDSNNLIL